MKKYIIFAGVNGAGKSSIYNEFKKEDNLGIRINADEIQVQQDKSLIEASKIAVKLLNDLLVGNETFHQETTFAGKKVLKSLHQAKNNGFYIKLYYIGLENKDLAVQRVADRVKKGGHDVPKNLIESRYDSSLENLKIAMNLVDEIEIYDNSNENRLIYLSKQGKTLYRSSHIPDWAKVIIDENYLESNDTPLKDKLKKAKEKLHPVKPQRNTKEKNLENH